MTGLNFARIQKMYRESFNKYGDSTDALLTPKGRQEERFKTLCQYLKSGDHILDFGCGLGYLYQYLDRNSITEFNYHGVDITREFIETCNRKFRADNCTFDLIDPSSRLADEFDVVYCSGVFNISYSSNSDMHQNYVYEKLISLFSMSKRLLICDFLSSNVDYRQQDSYHVDIGSLVDFCQNNLSRRWQLRHDILPYEVTLIVYTDDQINRTRNTYLGLYND